LNEQGADGRGACDDINLYPTPEPQKNKANIVKFGAVLRVAILLLN
jgi:hypothetical protein